MIPAAISNLENLQTLIIHSGTRNMASKSSNLPPEIWRLPHLRHLVFTDSYTLPIPVHGLTLPLENLQTLSGISDFVCSKRILEMMPNLKRLGFSAKRIHSFHNLVNLHQLEKLKITASGSFFQQGPHLAFPTALRTLTLVGGRLPWKDMSIVGSLPNLQVLKLKNHACYGDIWKTSSGEFRQLKFLLIDGSRFRLWITENDHFPRLKQLLLHNCLFLLEIPDIIGEIPTLELIEVDNRNMSVAKSARRIQNYQQSYGNDALHVRCI